MWSDAQQELLLEAGRQALAALGWRDVAVQPLAEPVGAAVEAANENPVAAGNVLAVYDLGGGTFDAALVRRTKAGFEIVGSSKGLDPCGGEDFDEELLGHIAHTAAARGESAHLFSPVDDESEDQRVTRLRFNLSLREEIVSAKEALSDSMQADVILPAPMEGQAVVTGQQFEKLIEEHVMRTVRILQDTVQGVIDRKSMTADELVGIVLTGGSSRIPMVERVVREKFGLQIFTQPDRKGVVALGAVRWKPEERPGRVENRKESGTFELQPPMEFRSARSQGGAQLAPPGDPDRRRRRELGGQRLSVLAQGQPSVGQLGTQDGRFEHRGGQGAAGASGRSRGGAAALAAADR